MKRERTGTERKRDELKKRESEKGRESKRKKIFFLTDLAQEMAGVSLMEELRGGGAQLGGPAPFSRRDRQLFANQLDRLLAQS